MRGHDEVNLITGVSFAFYMGWQIIAPIFPLYGLQVGASLVEVGVLLSLLSLATLLVRIPFGSMANRIGEWPIMVFACILQAISLLLFAWTPSPAWLFITMVLFGISNGSFGPPAASAAIRLTTSDKRGETTGKFYFAIGLAMFLGPFMTSLLVKSFTFQQFFLFIILFSISGLVILAMLKSSPNLRRREPQRREEGISGIASVRLFLSLLRKRKILTLFIVTMLFFICEGFFSTLFPVYGNMTLLLSLATIGILFACFGGMNALSRIPSGKLSDMIGRRKPLLLSYVLAIIAFLILSHAEQFLPLVGGMLVYGIAWGMRVPPSSALLGDVVDPKELSLAMACLWMAADLGGSVGSVLAGSLGSIAPFPFILQSLVAILGFCVILIVVGLKDVR